ncbi:MAG: hypothetical protein M5R36_26195 [Deltaproteobacteria bacterium]|nr:hypothetical protein [Deltaproteobacteria bacterium]
MENELFNQPMPKKLLQSFFLVFTAAAFAFSIWRLHAEEALTPQRIAVHYLGDGANGAEGDGLPEDPALGGGEMRFRKSVGGMIVVTHVHLFMIPAFFYLVGSVYLRSGATRAAALFVPTLGYAATAADMGGIWLVWSAGPSFTPLVFAAGVGMTASMAWMIAACLISLWRKTGRST